MARRPGAQRKEKRWLIAERILRVARVNILLFTFCWHGKQGVYTSHAKSAQEKQRAYTPHAHRAHSQLHAETAPANAAWADVLGRMLRVVFFVITTWIASFKYRLHQTHAKERNRKTTPHKLHHATLLVHKITHNSLEMHPHQNCLHVRRRAIAIVERRFWGA